MMIGSPNINNLIEPPDIKFVPVIQDIGKKITDALGGRGLFGVELFIKGHDVIFSEVSPRPHDTGMVTMVSQNMSEFELHVRAILGLPIPEITSRPGASAAILSDIATEKPVYEGLAEALKETGTWVRIFGKPVAHPKRRMGVALAIGATTDEARRKAMASAKNVRVVEAI